jgi:hypothetical protein
MKTLAFSSYRKRLLSGPWSLAGCAAGGCRGAVIIPACAEQESLPQTLTSLAANPQEKLTDWLVIVVVNQPADAAPADRRDNLATLDWLQTARDTLPNLAWVDAVSSGRQLPARDAGVGLARKLGCDLALERLRDERAVLASLDADTLVEPSYLQAMETHFTRTTAGGAALPFAHQPAATNEHQAAIDLYELYQRHYVYGLHLAESPYAYHSIGSALACRASAYLAAGGMNRRKAGEDFYFLQQLAKTSGVAPLSGTTVHPSPRNSHRVPFGTGEKVARLLRGEAAINFYPQSAFAGLQLLLRSVKQQPGSAAEPFLHQLTSASPETADFLRQERFVETWTKLADQHRTPETMQRAFHGWFDALKSWRLIRHLSLARPAANVDQALAELLHWGGEQASGDKVSILAQLRELQGAAARGATSPRDCAMLLPKEACGPCPGARS